MPEKQWAYAWKYFILKIFLTQVPINKFYLKYLIPSDNQATFWFNIPLRYNIRHSPMASFLNLVY